MLEELKLTAPTLGLKNALKLIEDGDRITMLKSAIELNASYDQPSLNPAKPNGIWYAFGGEWIEMTIDDPSMANFRGEFIYQLNLSGKNIKILVEKSIGEFDTHYKLGKLIDWTKVSADYDGVELVVEPDSLKSAYSWLRGWDLRSGCIWNTSSIGAEQVISERQKQANRKEANEEKEFAAANVQSELEDIFIDAASAIEAGKVPNWQDLINRFNKLITEFYSDIKWSAKRGAKYDESLDGKYGYNMRFNPHSSRLTTAIESEWDSAKEIYPSSMSAIKSNLIDNSRARGMKEIYSLLF